MRFTQQLSSPSSPGCSLGSRTSTPALLCLLLAFALAPRSSEARPDRGECLRARAEDLARQASCGDAGSINYCLSQLPTRHDAPHLCTHEALQACFVNAGCTADEARIETEWTLKRCDETKDAGAGELGDLRRRLVGLNNINNIHVPRADATTTTTAPATETPLQCFVTTTVSTTVCPIQSTGPNAGKETLPCFPTTASFPTCAPGLLCRTDAEGDPICMKLDNSLGVAGTIISIFFATALTAAIAGLCFCCCRERRTHDRLAKAAEAAAIAKAAALASSGGGGGGSKKRPSVVATRSVSAQSAASVSDAQPLMAQRGGGPPTVGFDLDPFGDQHPMR